MALLLDPVLFDAETHVLFDAETCLEDAVAATQNVPMTFTWLH